MEYVNIAQLRKPFGLKGQIHASSLTSFASIRFKKGRVYALLNLKGEKTRDLTLNAYRIQGDALVLGFKEIETPEEALELQRFTVALDKEDAPLPKGCVRYSEMFGYVGIDDEGNQLGTLVDVVEYSPTPNLKFEKADKKCFYVPFIDVFVGEIDYENKTIKIHVVEGML